ncbi:MAG: phytase [Henriciella sp.]|nr:phytase [Henriciella sp.]
MFRPLAFASLGLLSAACVNSPEVLPFEIQTVYPSVETAPMLGRGEQSADPAIWGTVTADQASLILGTNKDEGLHVYDLSGNEVQFLDVGAINNVDLRGRYAVASNDETNALSWFVVSRNAAEPVLHIGDTKVDTIEPYGVCLGQDDRGLVAAVTYKTGLVEFWRADQSKDADIAATLERTVQLPSQLEGCVFDDTQGLIFIGEEAFGLWALSYGDATAEPYVVDRIEDANGLVADVEGVSLYWAPNGGYIIASAQEADRFVVYDRLPPHSPRGIFAISASEDGAIDGVSHTDGLDVVSAALPDYPSGLLVVQDDGNPQSGVDQNFKLVDWAQVMAALGL